MRSLYSLFSKVLVVVALLLLAACGTGNVRDDNDASSVAKEASGSVRENFALGLKHMDDEKYQAAIDIFDQINEQNNQLAGVHANLGIAYGKLAMYEKAQAALEQAVRLNAVSSEILNEMAIAYRNNGDFEASKQTYEKILEKNAKSEQSHLNLGILCDIYMNDINCALEHYKEYQAIYASAEAAAEEAKVLAEQKTKDKPVKKEEKPTVYIPKAAKNEKVVHWITDLEKRK